MQAFFDQLGDEGRASIRAVSIDTSAGYENAVRSAVPDAEICFDLEGLNSKVRPISDRPFGFHSAAPLIALIYLCCGGIVINLPVK